MQVPRAFIRELVINAEARAQQRRERPFGGRYWPVSGLHT